MTLEPTNETPWKHAVLETSKSLCRVTGVSEAGRSRWLDRELNGSRLSNCRLSIEEPDTAVNREYLEGLPESRRRKQSHRDRPVHFKKRSEAARHVAAISRLRRPAESSINFE